MLDTPLLSNLDAATELLSGLPGSDPSIQSDARAFFLANAKAELELLPPRQLAENIVNGDYGITVELQSTQTGAPPPANFREKLIDAFEKIASEKESRADLIAILTDDQGNIDDSLDLIVAAGEDGLVAIQPGDNPIILFLDGEEFGDRDTFRVSDNSVTERTPHGTLRHELEHVEYHLEGRTFADYEAEEVAAIAEQNEFIENITPQGEDFVERIGHTSFELTEGAVTEGLWTEQQFRVRFSEVKLKDTQIDGSEGTWIEFFKEESPSLGDFALKDTYRLNGIFNAEVATQRAETGQPTLALDDVAGAAELQQITDLVTEKKDLETEITEEAFEEFIQEYLSLRDAFFDKITIDDPGVDIREGLVNRDLAF